MVRSGSHCEDDRCESGRQGGYQLQHRQRPQGRHPHQVLQADLPSPGKTHLRSQAVSPAEKSKRGERDMPKKSLLPRKKQIVYMYSFMGQKRWAKID